jgi:hypothetical protein
MYEAQDFNTPKARIDFSIEHCRFLQELGHLTLNTPLDMYVFGCILVHAPIKWSIRVETSLYVLVSSLTEHTSSGTKILGSIEELSMCNIPMEEIQQLPPSLQKDVIKLRCHGWHMPTSTILTYDYSFLSNLQSIDLDFVGVEITLEGIQALSDLITCSCTLQSVSLGIYFPFPWSLAQFRLRELGHAVLSSSTVTVFATDTLFVTNTVPKMLEYIHMEDTSSILLATTIHNQQSEAAKVLVLHGHDMQGSFNETFEYFTPPIQCSTN